MMLPDQAITNRSGQRVQEHGPAMLRALLIVYRYLEERERELDDSEEDVRLYIEEVICDAADVGHPDDIEVEDLFRDMRDAIGSEDD